MRRDINISIMLRQLRKKSNFKGLSGVRIIAAFSTSPVESRQFTYFDNVEIKEGNVAIIRFNSPKKMNTISSDMQAEVFFYILSLSIYLSMFIDHFLYDCRPRRYSMK